MTEHAITLSSGVELPAVGFGTWTLDEKTAPEAVAAALQEGYRLVDTAQRYHNEAGVGEGIRRSGIPREQVLVTSKLRGGDQGGMLARMSFEESLHNLGLDHLDIYLIHWPLPRLDLYVKSWKSLIRLRDEGLVRTIGVSNFTAEHIDRLVEETGEKPALNQVEMHVGWNQEELRAQMAERGIALQAWSPLGRRIGQLEDERIVAIAREHGVSPAQVALRWLWDKGVASVAKSSDPERRRQNLDIFGFQLTDEQTAAIDALPQQPIGPDPRTHEEF